ncbi:MAG: phasin [Propylenella sp.]
MATAPKAKAAKAAEEAGEAIAEAGKAAIEAAFAYPKFEVPEIVRSLAEQGLKQTREVYARAKNAAEEATDLLEDSLETSRKSMRDAQFKTLDMAKANADATFELLRQLLTVTSVSDAVQLQTAFARERFEAFVDFSKDVQEMMSKAGAEAGKPAKAILDKTLSFAKAA